MKFLTVILLSLFWCSSVAASASLSETLTIGGNKKINIPVPAGNWIKVAQRTDYRPSVPIIVYSFLNVVDGAVHSFLWARITKNENYNGWKYSKTCNRKNLHFIEKIVNNGGHKINCHLVNHWRVTGGKGGNAAPLRVQRETWDYIKKNNLKTSSTFIVASSYMAKKHLMEVRLGYNPEMFGFPPVVDSNWSSNDWHQDRIIGKPKMQSFINAMKEVSHEVHSKIEKQFF